MPGKLMRLAREAHDAADSYFDLASGDFASGLNTAGAYWMERGDKFRQVATQLEELSRCVVA